MRVLFVPSLIVFLAITLISSKPLEESKNGEDFKPLNRAEIAKMIENSKLLEILANETYLGKVPTSGNKYQVKNPTDEETYLSKDPTNEETYLSKDPTKEETYLSKDPTSEETYLSKDPTAEDPTAEQTKDATGVSGNEGEEVLIEEDDDEKDDEEEDDSTVDKPIDAQPVNFLKYPEYVDNFKPYPRFAILRNGYVHHMNLDF